jgi:hypothetical protein
VNISRNKKRMQFSFKEFHFSSEFYNHGGTNRHGRQQPWKLFCRSGENVRVGKKTISSVVITNIIM